VGTDSAGSSGAIQENHEEGKKEGVGKIKRALGGPWLEGKKGLIGDAQKTTNRQRFPAREKPKGEDLGATGTRT